MSLTTENEILSVILVRIYLSYYKDSPGATPIEWDLLFCDSRQDYIIDGKTYEGVGALMAITSSRSDIKASSGELTVTLTGIPNENLYSVLYSRIKGSPIQVSRAFYNPTTGDPIIVANDSNVVARYYGFINNYSLEEEYDVLSRTSSNTMVMTCSSSIDVLGNKIACRRTNESSETRFFPNDKSMNRVASLENMAFDFGKKK